MIEVKYVSGDGQTTLNLIGDKLRPTAGMVHIREWTPVVLNRTYGTLVRGFKKSPIGYDITLTLRGSLEERYKELDRICDLFEKDVINQTPGKLYFGDYYIKCFVTASETEENKELNSRTDIKTGIYCPYPFWIKEWKKSIPVQGGGSVSEGLDYNYDYNYDFAGEVLGSKTYEVGRFSEANFRMIIYGPCANPRISINGNVYQVYANVLDGEYLVIDTSDRTITKWSGGVATNLYDARNKQYDIFKPVSAERVKFTWNGSFGFDITLYLERSEPRWSA